VAVDSTSALISAVLRALGIQLSISQRKVGFLGSELSFSSSQFVAGLDLMVHASATKVFVRIIAIVRATLNLITPPHITTCIETRAGLSPIC
jgi:hypothetical protein